jgi:hypothetical protein
MRSSPKAVLAALAVVTAIAGCTDKHGGNSAPGVSFVTGYAPIAFSFPAGWYVNREENPYDLQCFSKSQRMTTGVFAFQKADIAADASPTDIFWKQINDLRAKRKNFKELESIQKQEYDGKTISSIAYTGEKDSSRNCYRFSLIEFRSDDSKFAVVVQTALPGEWEKSKLVLEEITRSAKPEPPGS